jgi:hypothetical protein
MRWAWWLKVQAAVVITGAVLTGVAAAAEFYRYLVIGGDLAQFNGTPLTNPFATPIFYAAVGLALAARLAWRQVQHPTARVEVAVGALLLAGAVLGLA